MADFVDLADAGAHLAPLVEGKFTDPLVLAVIPHGVPVAEAVAEALDVEVHGLTVVRTDEGVQVRDVPDVADREVVIVDDGVETGTAARAIAAAVRAGNPRRLVLAVPVCPRQEASTLALLYDDIIAVVQPLARRSLRWHYANAEWLG